MGGSIGVGIIGLGVISTQYLGTLATVPGVRITAVADLDAARADAVAAELEGARAMSPEELLADPEVDTVLNLTIPAAHASIALAAIANGKHVFGEKPLAVTFADGRSIVEAAAAAGVRVGSAPDTVLGTGVQTARQVIDRGDIGRPVSATATWSSPGHEAWHPHPDFYYRDGGGPLFDMGPYYLSSLVQLLGPVVAVSGASSRSRDARIIATGPRAGESIPVEVDTHVTGILHHESGALSTVTMSFDGMPTTAPPIEVHGVDGSVVVPDPNTFDGEVVVHRRGGEPEAVAPAGGYEQAGRGIGLVDFVRGPGRASGEVALHVLEIMTLLTASAHSGTRETLTTTVSRPEAVPLTTAEEWRGV
ncbi:Gfo/Idh/MocA family protein [Microbacterium sp. ZW T5_45]|uniref:Gfo/Idh/MocA family protein n=1 Tax=Microbacterium sp. ZW T5_45 TaxID=3378080 RepID=UPI0038529527